MSCYIKWIGQGGYILSDGVNSVCIDPYLSDIVEKVSGKKRLFPTIVNPEELESGLVICTHDHLDHLDEDAIMKMDKNSKTFAGPNSCISHLKELGIEKLVPFNIGDELKYGKFMLSAVFANHTEDSIGIIINYSGINIYLSADTIYDNRLEKISSFKPDIIIVCINGKLGNMDVNEAIKITKILKPQVGIPTHYGMFAENTENPQIYLQGLDHIKGFEMQLGTGYSLNEILE